MSGSFWGEKLRGLIGCIILLAMRLKNDAKKNKIEK
jgi:hypothetical protein